MANPNRVTHADLDDPAVSFAVREIARAMDHSDAAVESAPAASAAIVLLTRPTAEQLAAAGLGAIRLITHERHVAESYQIERVGSRIVIIGGGVVGTMYGGLEVAEAISLGTLEQLKAGPRSPWIGKRGLKINLPLDARTPSYSDNGDAARAAIPVVWEQASWQELLDHMARHRLNVLSLWSLHPFPSMVEVPEYPTFALADVWVPTGPFILDSSKSTRALRGIDVVTPESMGRPRIAHRLTIAQKTAFWREVMRMARERGIEVYLFTWNIFLYGLPDDSGLTTDLDDVKTQDYFRASVRAMLRAYPDLAGIGVTAGENMGGDRPNAAKQRWLRTAYGEAFFDVAQEQPGRRLTLIHRMHESNIGDMRELWKGFPGEFQYSYKYSVARSYAHPRPPFLEKVRPALPRERALWLTLRNDDFYAFRYYDPAFIRDYFRSMPHDRLVGFYFGADGYPWLLDPVSKAMGRKLVMDRQWLAFMQWGRLAYDPQTPDRLFEETVAARHPAADAPRLLDGLQAASRIIPLVNQFHWQDIDVKWFPEGSIAHPAWGGFHGVQRFVDHQPHPATDIIRIPVWADAVQSGRPIPRGTTPAEVCAKMDALVVAARAAIADIKPGQDAELVEAVADVQLLALLGEHYSAKILAAMELGLAGAAPQRVAEHRPKAIAHLARATERWKQYAALYVQHYQPQFLVRIGPMDPMNIGKMMDEDLARLRQEQPAQ